MKVELFYLIFLLTIGCIISSCDNPSDGSFDRQNPVDPLSEEFVPFTSGQVEVVVNQPSKSEIHIAWPSFYGVDKYRLMRSRHTKEEFILVKEIEGFRDTTYMDNLSEDGSYYYKIEAIGFNGNSSSLVSQRILNNWVDLPVISENKQIVPTEAYSNMLKDDKLFVHFFTTKRGGHYFVFDLQSGEWSKIDFPNYSDYVKQRRFINTDHMIFLDDSEFLLFDVFNELNTGFGPSQKFLGVVCSISNSSCRPVGDNVLDIGYYYNDVVHTKLSGNDYLIIGEISSNYLHFAYLLDGDNFTITKVGLPLSGKHPSELTLLQNGDVLACGERGYNGSPHRDQCQRFDPESRKWTYTKEMPLKYDNLASHLLSDGRVFFTSESDDNRSMIYNPIENSWTITSKSEFGTGIFFRSFYKGFRTFYFNDLIFEKSDGSLLKLNYTSERLGGVFGNYILEEYAPISDEWSNPIRLPNHVRYIYTAQRVTGDRILFIYRSEESTKTRSAYLYY